MDLVLNNLQRLICHKTQTTNQPINIICIVCARNSLCGYCLLLAFFSVKPFYFIRTVDVLSSLFKQIMNRYGSNAEHRQ